MRCRLCDSLQTVFLLASGNRHGRHLWDAAENFSLFKCQDCGSVFVGGQTINADYYKRYYPADYYQADNSRGPLKFFLRWLAAFSLKRKQRLILRFLEKQPGKYKILDIGCGQGIFLSKLNGVKFDKWGIEIHDVGYQGCRQRGLNVFKEKLENLHWPAHSFDAITLWHVLEHVDNPLELFQEIYRLLKPQGILVCAVPNVNGLGFRWGRAHWFHLDSPRHLILYNRESFERLCRKTNFKISKIKNEPYDYPLDLFWSLRKSRARFWIYPLYCLVKMFDRECLTVVCRKL